MYPCRTEYTSNSLVSRNYIKKINCKLSPTHTTEEVGYAFIIIRGVRPNTYPMHSAHQRYRHIHYFCLIHLKLQLLKGTPKVKAYSLQWLDSVITTTVLYTNTDPFTTCELYWHIGLVLYQKSDICKHSLLAEPWTWGLLQVSFPGRGKAVLESQ